MQINTQSSLLPVEITGKKRPTGQELQGDFSSLLLNITNQTDTSQDKTPAIAPAEPPAPVASATQVEESKESNSDDDDYGAIFAALDKKKDALQEFLDYMKQTPAQRMMEAWLKEHGITKEQFAAMSAEEKQKLMAKMREEIEEKIKLATENKMKEDAQKKQAQDGSLMQPDATKLARDGSVVKNYNVNHLLSDDDKKITGWDPAKGTTYAQFVVAMDRVSGKLPGPLSADYINGPLRSALEHVPGQAGKADEMLTSLAQWSKAGSLAA